MTAVPLFDGHHGRHCCERPHRLCALRARVVRTLASLWDSLATWETFLPPAPYLPDIIPGPAFSQRQPGPPVTYDEIDAGWPHQPEPGIVPYDEDRPATWADIAAGMPGRRETLPGGRGLMRAGHPPWATEGQPAFRPPTEPAGLPALGPACLLPAERIPPQIAAYFDQQAQETTP